jgi:hypothetical protein
MSDHRLARLMGPAGIVILVLVFLGFGPLNGSSPGENASGAAVVLWYRAHMSQQWLAFYFIGAAIGLLIFYSVVLRSKLRQAGAGNILPTAAFGGGLMVTVGVLASGMIHQALIASAHENRQSIAHILNFVDQNNFVVITFGVCAMALFAGAAILNRSSLPRWLGWVSVVIGVVAALGDFGFFGVLAWGIWLPVAGFVIGNHQPAVPLDGQHAAAPQGLGTSETVSSS